MSTLDEFIATAESHKIRLHANKEGLKEIASRHDDAFFQSPLLSLCLAIIANERAGKLTTADVPVWVGATLAKHFDDSTVVRMQLEWSIQYRQRCADSIVFLENLGLIDISGETARSIACTSRGHSFVRKVLGQEDEIGILSRSLMKAFRVVDYQGLKLL